MSGLHVTQQVLQGMGLAGVPQAGSNTLLVAATHGGFPVLSRISHASESD